MIRVSAALEGSETTERWSEQKAESVLCQHHADRNLIIWMLCLALSLFLISEIRTARASDWLVTPYHRVIWIGVDGIGTFIQDTDTPNFDRIFSDEKITWNACAPEPTVSAPGWCSMFYGVSADIHGVTNDIAESSVFQNRELKSVFRQTLDTYPGQAVGVFATWYAIGYGMVDWRPDDLDLTRYPFERANAQPEQALEAAMNWIREQDDFKLLFFYLDNTDLAGHTYGYGSPAYLGEITRADALIGTLYDALSEKGLLEDSLIILSTDHGGTPDGTHGGGTRAETRCVFAASGPNLSPDTEIGSMELKDIAAVVRYALGLEQPRFSDAKVPEGLFLYEN